MGMIKLTRLTTKPVKTKIMIPVQKDKCIEEASST
jgi:hypothetical protein